MINVPVSDPNFTLQKERENRHCDYDSGSGPAIWVMDTRCVGRVGETLGVWGEWGGNTRCVGWWGGANTGFCYFLAKICMLLPLVTPSPSTGSLYTCNLWYPPLPVRPLCTCYLWWTPSHSTGSTSTPVTSGGLHLTLPVRPLFLVTSGGLHPPLPVRPLHMLPPLDSIPPLPVRPLHLLPLVESIPSTCSTSTHLLPLVDSIPLYPFDLYTCCLWWTPSHSTCSTSTHRLPLVDSIPLYWFDLYTCYDRWIPYTCYDRWIPSPSTRSTSTPVTSGGLHPLNLFDLYTLPFRPLHLIPPVDSIPLYRFDLYTCFLCWTPSPSTGSTSTTVISGGLHPSPTGSTFCTCYIWWTPSPSTGSTSTPVTSVGLHPPLPRFDLYTCCLWWTPTPSIAVRPLHLLPLVDSIHLYHGSTSTPVASGGLQPPLQCPLQSTLYIPVHSLIWRRTLW
jgi:hypothetical protein